MATKKIQVLDSSNNIYHLETQADLVLINSNKFESSNVQDALEEIKDNNVKKGMTWNELEGV